MYSVVLITPPFELSSSILNRRRILSSLSFWSINFIGLELEDPFGGDANDLPIHSMQVDLNQSLKELLKPMAMKAPGYDFNKAYHARMPVRVVDFKQKMYETVAGYKKKRPIDAFEIAEAEAKARGAIFTMAPPPPKATAPAPVVLPPLAVAPPPAPAPAPAPAQGEVASKIADQKLAVASIEDQNLKLNTKM